MRTADSSTPVLLATFTDTFKANVVKGMLESNGIPVALDGETVLSVLPMPSALGPVRMMVLPSDYSKAVALLREHGDCN